VIDEKSLLFENSHGNRIDAWATAKTAEWRRLEEAERSAGPE
jgi:hypothetical protein